MSSLPLTGKLVALCGFFLASLILVIGYTVATLDSRASDATVINVAGRQHMLTQKFTKDILNVLYQRAIDRDRGESESAADLQSKAGKLFEVSLVALINGGTTYSDLGMKNEITLPPQTDSKIVKRLGDVRDIWQEFQSQIKRLDQAKAGDEEHAAALKNVNELSIKALKTMNSAVGMMAAKSTDAMSGMVRALWLILAVTVVLGVGVAFAMIRGILRPLRSVTESIELLAQGVLSQDEVPILSDDETGQLAHSFNDMLSALRSVGANVDRIASGEANVRFEPASERDELAVSLNRMTEALEARGREELERERARQQERREQQERDAETEREAARLEQERREAAAEAEREAKRFELQQREAAAAAEREQVERARREAEEMQAAVDELLLVVRAAADGDLNAKFSVTGNEAIEQVAAGLDAFFFGLRDRIQQIASNANELAGESQGLSGVSEEMASGAAETSTQASVVSSAAERVSESLESVAAATQQLDASIHEISRQSRQVSVVTSSAIDTVGVANDRMTRLSESTAQIVSITSAITTVAKQTNLLALNAHIEAARAGEAGRGFGVVANEVKELARQTAAATENIERWVSQIQEDSRQSVESITEISSAITSIDEAQASVAAAVEQQQSTTRLIATDASEAARGSQDIAHGIQSVAQAADKTNRGATETQSRAKTVRGVGEGLRSLVAAYRC